MTPSDYQAEILAELGDNPIPARFQLLLPLLTTAGTWTATLLNQTSGSIAFDATPAAVQAELEEIAGSGNVRVTGQRRGPYVLELVGELAGQPVTTPTASGTGLTPSAGLVWTVEQEPKLPRYSEAVQTLWAKYAYESGNELRKARVKLELLERESGRLKDLVDQDDGQESYDASQKFKANEALIRRVQAQIASLEAKQIAGSVNSSRHGSVVVHSVARANFRNWQRGL